ncbi:MAG: phage major capsid protein [Lewinellaceae bacterium]|nr:phage major capsid protein [Lewinellaceae bacterium]
MNRPTASWTGSTSSKPVPRNSTAKSAAISANKSRPPRRSPTRKVWRKWAVRGHHALSHEEQTILSKGEQRGTNTLLASDTSTTYAGYMVPEGFSNEISHTLKAYGGMLQACRIFPTATGNNIQWPTLDDTSNTGELTAEGAALTVLDATFSRKTLSAYNITSKLTKVSLQLIQDEGVMFDTELPKILGTRLGRALNTYLTTGSGTSQPAGVMTATVGSAAGVTAGATSITRANLIDLVGSVDPEFLAVPGQKAWMFNNATLTYLKKLSIGSADDRPLLYMGMDQSAPRRWKDTRTSSTRTLQASQRPRSR